MNEKRTKKDIAVIEIMPQISVDMRSRESIFEGINALIRAKEPEAAAELLTESEKLHEEGIKVRVILVMDVSGSMDSAGNIKRVQQGLPDMLRPAAGEIPVEVLVRLVCFGDTKFGDKIHTWDFRLLETVAGMVWPQEGGGSPSRESHIEALLHAIGAWRGDETLMHLAHGATVFSPLLPKSSGEILLVTDDERPRLPLARAKENLLNGWRLTIVADSTWEEFWGGLLREGDRFVRLDGNLNGLLRSVQDAISDAVVSQATNTVALIAAKIQNEVAGLLAAPMT